jgi:toxin ParE1/3/4
MKYQVYLSAEAEEDIFDIWNYVSRADSPVMADRLLDELQATCFSLSEFPERGHYPPELERVHVTEYREIHWKPYRIIYRVEGDRVFIYCVLDGRRNVQDLLIERSIRAH